MSRSSAAPVSNISGRGIHILKSQASRTWGASIEIVASNSTVVRHDTVGAVESFVTKRSVDRAGTSLEIVEIVTREAVAPRVVHSDRAAVIEAHVVAGEDVMSA